MKITPNIYMMSVSQVAVQQREEESKKLRFLLICSISGSLALHIVILVSGIIDLLSSIQKEPSPKPLEITFIDIPPEPPKPVEKKPEPKLSPPPELPKPKIENTPISPQLPLPSPPQVEQKTQPIQRNTTLASSSGSNSFSKPNIRPFKPLITPSTFRTPVSQPQPTQQPIIEPKPEIKPEITPEIKPRITPRSFTTPEPISKPIVKSTPEITPRSFTAPKPISTPVVKTTPPTTNSSFSTASAPMNSENLEKLRTSLSKTSNTASNNLRTSRELFTGDNQNNVNNPNANNNFNPGTSSNNTSGTNTNSRTLRNTFTGDGNGNGNGSGNGNKTTALNPQISNSGDGRASCVQCGSSYPSWARRRGVEGRVVVAVDTDSAGNVINVQLVSSSGSSRLDEEHLQMVRGWKLKPSENGRTGVTIATEYVLK